MALPATLVWEVRPTNGTANAGGGFDPSVASPGTDYSQQDAVQVAYTDLVIDAATNTNVTSAGTPFTSAHVGNNLAVTGGTGFTTGIYNIRSVSSNVATLDRAVGTTSSTGGTGNLGGARSGFSVGTTTLQSSLVAGNKVWVKNEAWNEAVVLSVSGSSGNPIVIEGYNSSRGDIDLTTGNSNNPTNDRGGAAGHAMNCAAVTNHLYKNLTMKDAGSAGFFNWGLRSNFINCRGTDCGTSGFARSGNTATNFTGCEGDNNASSGFDSNAVASIFYGCYAHDNTGTGITTLGTSIFFCISEANSSHGISSSGGGPGLFINNTLDGNTGASTDGFVSSASPPTGISLLNNIFSNNGRYGANANSSDFNADFNDYYSNGTAARNNVPVGDNDLTSDPTFTDRSNGDFTVGTNMRAAGWPGTFPG